MGLMSLIAPNLKILVEHVPTLLFEVVPWPTLMRDGAQLSKRLLTAEGAAEVQGLLAAKLPRHIQLCDSTALKAVDDPQRAGDLLLEFYFRSVLSGGPFFLDLRASHCGLNPSGLQFAPNGLWGEFSAPFAEGLRALYFGFYHQDEERFNRGLLLTGLVQADWPTSERQHMADLFRQHFGSAREAPMRFQLQNFQTSFTKVFEFLLHKKVYLSTDFLLLGISLVTLYLSLEKWGTMHAVSKIFNSSQLDVSAPD